MAEVDRTLNGGDATHDLKSLLSAEGRDFLVRNNGDQVSSKPNSYQNSSLKFIYLFIFLGF